MRLNEFLDQHLPPYMLINQLDKQYDIIITPYDDSGLSWNILSFDISRDDLKAQLDNKKISTKEFQEIIKKFGWYISYIRGDRLNLTVENNLDNNYYSNDNSIFKNLYLHVSNAKPSMINSKGLIAKDSTDPNVEKDLTMQRGIIYPNKRVYLWNLEDASGNLSAMNKNFDRRLLSTFSIILNGLHASSYGAYIYLIELPTTIKLHYDNEYGTDNPARYITQNIPPSYIKYIGTTNRLLDIISDNDSDRLKQILKIR